MQRIDMYPIFRHTEGNPLDMSNTGLFSLTPAIKTGLILHSHKVKLFIRKGKTLQTASQSEDLIEIERKMKALTNLPEPM
jgi:hypothetical protein